MQITFLPDDKVSPGQPVSPALKTNSTLASEKKRLYQVAREMESLFLYQMLQAMRQTIPKSESPGGFSQSGGLGKDIYTQMFDQELADRMAGTSAGNLADMIYGNMEKVLERQYHSKSESPAPLRPLFEEKKPLNIITEEPPALPLESEKPRELPTTLAPEKSTSLVRPRRSPAEDDIDKIIDDASRKYRLDPEVIKAVIKIESGGNPQAVSPAGAKGLMQLIDSTASDMGVKNAFNPKENIEGGARYLRRLLDQFGELHLALAAYNAGPGAVMQHGGIPPYRETQNYVKNVLAQLSAGTVLTE